MTLPSPLFTINGGDPGAKASVAASSTVTCVLDDIVGVTYVEWTILTTDETTAPGDYTLSTSGGVVPGNETMTFTSGAAATGGLIWCRINNGVNAQTGNADVENTESTAKWYVPTTSGGFEVFVDGETDESDPEHGDTGEKNQAIRALGGGGSSAFAYLELGTGAYATAGLLRMGRNFTGIACRTSGGQNHSILREDNADGLIWGDSSRTVLQTAEVVSPAGYWRVKVGSSEIVRINGNGIDIFDDTKALMIGGTQAVVSTAGVPTLGTSATNTIINCNANVAIKTSGTTRATVDSGGLTLASGTTLDIDTVAVLSLPSAITIGADAGPSIQARAGGGEKFAVSFAGVDAFSVDDGGGGATINPTGSVTIQVPAGESVLLQSNGFVGVSVSNPATGATALANGAFTFTETTFGAFGATATTKRTVSGARGGNAALASLLTALADLGWITDSTSA